MEESKCFIDNSILSIISKDESDVLSVSISEDSLLSDIKTKNSKRPIIIKLGKKWVSESKKTNPIKF